MKTLIALFCFLPIMVYAKSFVPASFSAQFEETLISKATGKEKKSSGKIDYQFPSHIRYEEKSPGSTVFVSNNQKSWYYKPPFIETEQGEVTVSKASKFPMTKFLDSIQNGVENSKLFTHKYSGKELRLTFTPAMQKDSSLKEVILLAASDAKVVEKMNNFEKITLVYLDGRQVTLKFTDFNEKPVFTNDHFEFKVPPKTKVSTN